MSASASLLPSNSARGSDRSLAAVVLALGIVAQCHAPPSSYEGPNDHRMVVLPAGELLMGSPTTEAGRADEEVQHRVRIPRSFAIATTEVTNEQYARFLAAVPDYAKTWKAETARFGEPPSYAEYSRTPDSPQVAVSWYDAARYCNWLSEQAGIPREQWVYPETIVPEDGIVLPPDYLHRTGYRLPTEAEWEYAARAGTTTSRHFGDDEGLLGKYAWFDGNTQRERAFPVAQLLPNPWGLYDMLGNAWEWTFDRRCPYPPGAAITEDTEDTAALRVSNDVARTRRGGSFAYEAFTARSAHRGDVTYFPNQTRDNVGFRVARTVADLHLSRGDRLPGSSFDRSQDRARLSAGARAGCFSVRSDLRHSRHEADFELLVERARDPLEHGQRMSFVVRILEP